MLIKPPCWVLIIEILICFIPITLLWALGCFVAVAILFKEFDSIFSWFSLISAIFLLLGGMGLIGIFQIAIHIFDRGYQPATASIYRKLYAGILSLVLLNGFMIFTNGNLSISPMIIVFLTPIICSLHLISITKKSESKNESSLFNDV